MSDFETGYRSRRCTQDLKKAFAQIQKAAVQPNGYALERYLKTWCAVR